MFNYNTKQAIGYGLTDTSLLIPNLYHHEYAGKAVVFNDIKNVIPLKKIAQDNGTGAKPEFVKITKLEYTIIDENGNEKYPNLVVRIGFE